MTSFPLPSPQAALSELVEAARKIGQDPSLVLRGGGNCSVKSTWTLPDGSEVNALYVKGSGHDLGTLTDAGLTPLHLDLVRGYFDSPLVTQDSLMEALLVARLDPSFPQPSVESLVHATIDQPFVLHSHADVVQAITDTKNAQALVNEIWGEDVLFIPYASPGLPLGRAVKQGLADAPHARVIIVGAHGVFAFGPTAPQALADHQWVIARADKYLKEHPLSSRDQGLHPPFTQASALELSSLRRELSNLAGTSLILSHHPESALDLLSPEDPLVKVLQRGPATPDHVTWVGPQVLSTTDPAEYARNYRSYVERQSDRIGEQVEPFAGFPRALIVAGLGFVTAGRQLEEAEATRDICEHTLTVVRSAEGLGGYQPASEDHVFDLEYWRPQRDKYYLRDESSPDAGRVVLVTGAASGIGRGCAEAFLARGACVVGWDIDEAVISTFDSPRWLGQQVDVTDVSRQEEALVEAVQHFGGIDVFVPAAGVFPSAQHIEELDLRSWRRTLDINTTGAVATLQLVRPYLANAFGGGYVCAIASKNVAAPGYGAAAYSASKAALTQVLRVAALEWAGEGIRVNMVHPDAVFDTALWTPALLAARAEHYGMSVEEYKRRNLLGVEITSRKVGDLAAVMCSPVFACTTGAGIPIDGGNERVI